jgi:hypothetical protein
MKEGHLHIVKYRSSFDRITDIRFMGISQPYGTPDDDSLDLIFTNRSIRSE